MGFLTYLFIFVVIMLIVIFLLPLRARNLLVGIINRILRFLHPQHPVRNDRIHVMRSCEQCGLAQISDSLDITDFFQPESGRTRCRHQYKIQMITHKQN